MGAADGHVVKAKQRKDESGARINEDGEKTGSYAKWAKTSKKRIQKVGELENASQPAPLGKWAKQQAEAQSRTVEFGGDDDNDGAIGDDANKRKPVVPFHGQVDAKHLTHKQKRMLQKRANKDSVVHGQGKREIKTATEIQKERFKRDQNKVRQNPEMRK